LLILHFQATRRNRNLCSMLSNCWSLSLCRWLLLYNIRTFTRARRSRNSIVGIATGYGLEDQGVGVQAPVGSTIFSSPHRLDRLWGPPNLISNRYWG
jgi:hypothetical protein